MAKKAEKRPAVQLFEQVFSGQTQRRQLAGLKNYLQEGQSIFPLVERGAERLAKDFSISLDDAQRFLRRANALAIYLRRQYIEHTLRGAPAEPPPRARSGLMSFVDGPNYESLFSPRFDQLAPPESLEDCTREVAYLVELYRWINERIETAGDSEKIPLQSRRVDIKDVVVDARTVHQAISSVDVIVKVLEAFIGEHGEADLNLETALIEARYPNELPYYQPWVTINEIVRHRGLSVGHFAHWVQESYPEFLQPMPWGDDAGRALAHASRLGPYQRKLLTEPPVEDAERDAFYAANYGTLVRAGDKEEDKAWQQLDQVPLFGERTGLSARALEELLSLHDFAPTRSANVTVYPQAAQQDSTRAGSVYINGGEATAIRIQYDDASGRQKLSAAPVRQDRYDRMNRKVRLDRWLGQKSHEVDALLVAAFNAETAGGALSTRPLLISANVVHVLGMFQILHEGYGCSVADFVVFIDKLGIYGRGEAPAQFDEIFNNVRSAYPEPLLLDDGEFALLPAPGTTELTVNRICSALSIDPQTYYYLAQAIARAHQCTDHTLLRSADILSAFYRLVKLPRLLKMTPVEGVLMLQVLGGDKWVDGLAGVPQVKGAPADGDTTPDALSLMWTLVACRYWCQSRNLQPLWMLQQAADPRASAVASERELQLFEQVRNLLNAALLTHAGFLMAGAPGIVGGDWRNFLAPLTDPRGLVKSFAGSEAEYLALVRFELDKGVRDALDEQDPDVRQRIVEQMLPVVVQARDAQVSVVSQCLAVYLGLDAERALLILRWANSSVYPLLEQILAYDTPPAELPQPTRIDEIDPVFILLADVRRRSAVTQRLQLSVTLLDDYLRYGYQAWMGQANHHEFSVSTLYYLTVLTHAFELSEQPAEALLDYLRLVNELPEPEKLTGDALRLAQQSAEVRLATFLRWSLQEVRECVGRLEDPVKLVRNLRQLDLLMRVRELARHTDMDASTIFQIGDLAESTDSEPNRTAYKEAAEHALLSVAETDTARLAPSDELLRPLIKMTIAPDNTTVVAGSDQTITLTITLKDANDIALSGIAIHGEASLGTLDIAPTSVEGVTVATYTPGRVMGSERPLFRVSLLEPEEGRQIDVVDDALTRSFPGPLRSRIPSGVVPWGQMIELTAIQLDIYSNLGKGQLVRWSVKAHNDGPGQAVIWPEQSLTDQQGLTRAFVSSPTGGRFVCSVRSEGSDETAHFEPITFAPPPAAE
jgi:hypothetical protein